MPVPSKVAPSLKLTKPFGIPAPELTVAERMIDCPNMDGFSEVAILVAVAAGLTVCVRGVDVLSAKFPAPE